MEAKYRMEIPPNTIQFILNQGQKKYPEKEIAIILADLHSNGSAMAIEIVPNINIEKRLHFIKIFPKGYQSFPFPIYIDMQIINEGYLPEHMKIDLVRNSKGILVLDFFNTDFED